MALTTTISEIQQVLPDAVSNLNAASRLPNFGAIEEMYLIPLIGRTLYDDLSGKYNANPSTLTPDEQTLVKHMRLLTAAWGFHDTMTGKHVFLTDDGVRVNSTNEMQKAARWEFEQLKLSFFDTALDASEILLNYLWAHKADYAKWTGSDEFKKFEGLLIRTGGDFNEHYTLRQPMRTFYAMHSMVVNAQKWYLQSGIGKSLLEYFCGVAVPSEDEVEIIEELKVALANFSVKHACEKFSVDFDAGGFTVLSTRGGGLDSEDAGRTNVKSEQIVRDYRDVCDRDGKKAMVKAKKLCVALFANNAATVNFKTAFSAGPLANYSDPSNRTLGNEKRKIFRSR